MSRLMYFPIKLYKQLDEMGKDVNLDFEDLVHIACYNLLGIWSQEKEARGEKTSIRVINESNDTSTDN